MGQTYLLILRSFLQRQEATRDHTLGTQMLVAAISGSLFYCEDTGAGKGHFGISTGTCPHPAACQHQYWDTSTPPTSRPSALRPPEALAAPGHGPVQHRMQNISPPSSTLTLALGPLGPQNQPLGTGLTHQRANVSTRTPGPYSQRPWDLTWLTSKSTLALASPRP